MGRYGVAEARNRLSELISRALKGEDIVITRHGNPVVELKPIPQPGRRVTAAALDWMAAHRVKARRSRQGAGVFVSRMRDEENR